MVHYEDTYTRSTPSVGRLFKRLLGIACLLSVPGIWFAVNGALPEARIMGLSLSVVLMGLAGICLFERK
ncbi:hypothetical protein MWU54_13285 [Marivita sp. S6314]|uniref:hypothetical protein n=1 Tax=Marivita sp. S6314 TaxID=2926406 RepID=UPI001FF618BB|nr:hypothetical protein [Marivita sp. S6314]MCK0151007.1 hypothetical protein [Marivita sp. S6314]